MSPGKVGSLRIKKVSGVEVHFRACSSSVLRLTSVRWFSNGAEDSNDTLPTA
jgi:hypothetical protein